MRVTRLAEKLVFSNFKQGRSGAREASDVSPRVLADARNAVHVRILALRCDALLSPFL